MKKIISRIIIFAFLLLMWSGFLSQKGSTISAQEVRNSKIVLKVNSTKMTVNGKNKDIDPGRDTKPLIINGRTLMPIRALVEEMGGIAEWDGVLKNVRISCNNRVVEMHIGSKYIMVDGNEDILEVEPLIVDGRTMIPLRKVIEAIGGEITWDESSKTIEIKYNLDNTLRGDLYFWVMPNSASADRDVLDVIKPFLDKNPELTVNVEVVDWGSALTKLVLQSVSGDSDADISQVGVTWNGALSSGDTFIDLTGKYDQSKFLPQVLNSCKLSGSSKVTNIPWFVDTRALYYRKDACQKVGVDPKKDFETWDSFKAALKKLKNVDINGTKLGALGMPGKNDWNVVHNFSWWIWGAGGDFFSPDNKNSIINSENSFKGIKFYSSLFNEGLVDEKWAERNSNDIEYGFIEGKFATMFGGPWIINSMTQNKMDGSNDIYDKVGVTLVPKGPKDRYGFIGGSNLGIFKSSKNVKAAVSLLNYLGSREAQIAYAKKTGYMPAANDALEDNYIVKDPMRKIFKDMIKNGKGYSCIPEWASTEVTHQEAFSKIFDSIYVNKNYNDNTIKKLLNDAKKEIDSVFEEYE